jgi:two-component system, NarL family, nitrate/nitrite response regulator NarL
LVRLMNADALRQAPIEENRPRVAVASAVRLFRDGLVELLNGFANLEVVTAQPMTAVGMVQLAGLTLDVILAHVFRLEDCLLLGSLGEVATETRLIAVGVPDVDELIIACADLGVAAYLGAEATLDDLLRTVRAVTGGRSPGQMQRAAALMQHLVSGTAATRQVESSLTSRELEIAYLLKSGLSNKQIAARLSIDVSTVKSHIHSILQKLHVCGRAEAVARLHQDGLTRSSRP